MHLVSPYRRQIYSGMLPGWVAGHYPIESCAIALATGLDVMTAFTAVLACVNNIGPGLGDVGPAVNYSTLTDLQTWLCTFAMLLGRLELLSLLVLSSPSFWRK